MPSPRTHGARCRPRCSTRCARASASAAPRRRRCASSTAATRSPFPVTPPDAVVFCESTEDVAAVVALARRACGAGHPVRHRLVAGRAPAGGAGRRQHRRLAHDGRRARERRGPDGHGAGRRHARAAQPRDQGPGPVLPHRPRRQRQPGRHGGHARQRHERRALRHDARQRAGADGGHGRRRGHPHRHAREEEQRRLRPDAAVRRQRRHAGRDHRGDAEAVPAARGRQRRDLPLPQHRQRGGRDDPGHPDGRADGALRAARRERGARSSTRRASSGCASRRCC